MPDLGIIENMSYFVPEELPDNKYYIFGKGNSEEFAKKVKTPFLGKIPMVAGISESGDSGNPIMTTDKGPIGEAFSKLADGVIMQTNALDRFNK